MTSIRQFEGVINGHFHRYRQALILLGARQIGKTTILRKVFSNAKYLLMDEEPIRNSLETYSSDVYKQIIGDAKQIILDELHLLSNPGRAVKLFYDQIPDLQIIVTGSSSLHIKNKTAESMAGRSIYYYMFPLTYSEFLVQSGVESQVNSNILERILDGKSEKLIKLYDQKNTLERVLLYGLYPHLINSPEDVLYLKNLVETAVFKDIIELNLIDNRAKALELLKVLAYQIGNVVSYSEIANRIGVDMKTVQRYVEIFEQSFIIYRIYPFSANKRREIGKSPKIYFNDLGLRNALIDNFDKISLRSDCGAMFENFIFSEVRKLIEYNKLDWNMNYWRLKSGAEVDLILSNSRETIATEIKFGSGKVSAAFKNYYPDVRTHLLTSENFY